MMSKQNKRICLPTIIHQKKLPKTFNGLKANPKNNITKKYKL